MTVRIYKFCAYAIQLAETNDRKEAIGFKLFLYVSKNYVSISHIIVCAFCKMSD